MVGGIILRGGCGKGKNKKKTDQLVGGKNKKKLVLGSGCWDPHLLHLEIEIRGARGAKRKEWLNAKVFSDLVAYGGGLLRICRECFAWSCMKYIYRTDRHKEAQYTRYLSVKHIPYRKFVSVPSEGTATPTDLLFLHLETKQFTPYGLQMD